MLKLASVLALILCTVGFAGGYYWLGPKMTEAAIANTPDTRRDGIDIAFKRPDNAIAVIPTEQQSSNSSTAPIAPTSIPSAISAGE